MVGENFVIYSSQLAKNALKFSTMVGENVVIFSSQLAKNALKFSIMVGEYFRMYSSQLAKHALFSWFFYICPETLFLAIVQQWPTNSFLGGEIPKIQDTSFVPHPKAYFRAKNH